MKPLMITVCGCDGGGKSTLVASLAKHFEETGQPYRTMSLLGHSPIRDHLLSNDRLTMVERVVLYRAAAEQCHREMRAAITEGHHVLCDRGPESFIAYQGYGEKCLSETKTLNLMFPSTPVPDISFYLDVSPEVGLSRVRSRGALDIVEQRPLQFFHDVRAGYHKVFNYLHAQDDHGINWEKGHEDRHARRIKWIDTEANTEEEIANLAVAIVQYHHREIYTLALNEIGV